MHSFLLDIPPVVQLLSQWVGSHLALRDNDNQLFNMIVPITLQQESCFTFLRILGYNQSL